MQKKLTVLFAFAVFVLVVGMQTDGYACHVGTKHKSPSELCGGGSEVPDSATLSLAGGMVTRMNIPVVVGQNSSKRLRFVNPDFVGQHIELRFNTIDCEMVDGVFDPGDKAAFEKELGGEVIEGVPDYTFIESGFIEVKIDRKNLENSILVIEYQGRLSGNGTRIMFPQGFVGTYDVSLNDSRNPITFTFSNNVYLRQLTPGGAQNDPILRCPGQSVTGTLDLGS